VARLGNAGRESGPEVGLEIERRFRYRDEGFEMGVGRIRQSKKLPVRTRPERPISIRMRRMGLIGDL